jgi:DNA-binding NarL/FixJ family response regulator
MLGVVSSHPGLELLGSSDVAPAIVRPCHQARVQVAIILAGPVPLEVLHVVASLRSASRRVETVALVEDPPDANRIQALLAAGARGILSEQVGGDDIHRAVRAVVAGGCVLGPVATEQVLERAGWAQQQFLGVPLESLDLEILSLLADGRSGSEAAEHLGLDEVTVRSTIRAAKRAFGQRTQEGVVAAAIQRGLI